MILSKNISKELKEQAIKLGLCSQWQEKWHKKTKDELVEMYIRGIDFAIDNDWPTCDYMKRHFNGIMQRHGVFVDDVINRQNLRQCICNGNTRGIIEYNSYSVGSLYIRHNSNVHIKVKDNAMISIELYDNAVVHVENTGNKAVTIYRHGGQVNSSGIVLVKNK